MVKNMTKPFARQGHFTTVDNAVFDEIMPELSGSEWKILCFIIRKTIGWKKESDEIAYSQFRDGAGIKSNTTVQKAINGLLDKGLVLVGKTDSMTDAHHYKLNTDYEIRVTETVKRPVTFSVKRPVTETVNTKESIKEKNIKKEYFVPNGTMSPPLPENPKPPKSKPKSKPESDDTVVTEMLAAWGRLFPDKPQPRPTTYRSKIQTQLKMPQFREGWLEAMEWAANSPTCQNESWFHFGFFVQQTKGEYGWEKCLRHWMEWKDKKIRANGNGRTDCVNDVWQSIKIALGKPGKPDISDRALQAVSMVPGGWRRFKEQDVRFIDQLKPLFEEAYERTKQQPATA